VIPAGTYLPAAPKPRKSTDCGWCRFIPLNPGPVPILEGCSCAISGAPDPCDSPRCPAREPEEAPIGSYRLVSNA
jgi:hypothetical protein